MAPAAALLVATQLATFPFGSALPPLEPPDSPFRVARLLGRIPGAEDGRVLSIPDVAGGWQLRERTENLLGAEHSILPPRFARVLDHFDVNLVLGRLDWDALARPRASSTPSTSGLVVAPSRLEQPSRPTASTGSAARPRISRCTQPRSRRAGAGGLRGERAAGARGGARPRARRGLRPAREVVLEEAPRGRYPRSRPCRRLPRSSAATARRASRVTTRPAAPASWCWPTRASRWTATVDGVPAPILCANVSDAGGGARAGSARGALRYPGPGSCRPGAAAPRALAVCALLLVRSRPPGVPLIRAVFHSATHGYLDGASAGHGARVRWMVVWKTIADAGPRGAAHGAGRWRSAARSGGALAWHRARDALEGLGEHEDHGPPAAAGAHRSGDLLGLRLQGVLTSSGDPGGRGLRSPTVYPERPRGSRRRRPRSRGTSSLLG
jgi:hypothetical protein